jgi:hypothetical protein
VVWWMSHTQVSPACVPRLVVFVPLFKPQANALDRPDVSMAMVTSCQGLDPISLCAEA